MRGNNFEAEDLCSVDKASSLFEAQKNATEILERCRQKTNPTKIGVLLENIRCCKNKTQVSKIMWNLLLSGEKLSAIGSSYQRKFN